jgi:hypothetical protein
VTIRCSLPRTHSRNRDRTESAYSPRVDAHSTGTRDAPRSASRAASQRQRLRKFSGSFSGESRTQHVRYLRSGALGASAAADDRDAAETDSASTRTSSRSGGSTTRGATAIPGGERRSATKSASSRESASTSRAAATASASSAACASGAFPRVNTRKFEYTKGAMRAFSSPSPSSFAVSSRLRLRTRRERLRAAGREDQSTPRITSGLKSAMPRTKSSSRPGPARSANSRQPHSTSRRPHFSSSDRSISVTARLGGSPG